jgi:hypothetical protein
MTAAASDYNDAQTASSADAFRLIIADPGVARYTLAARIDLFFAAAYALFAASVSMTVSSARTALRWIGSAGAGGVLVAAGLDEYENFKLLRNLSRQNDVGNAAIEQMTRYGGLKWTVGGVGAVVVLGCALIDWPPWVRGEPD